MEAHSWIGWRKLARAAIDVAAEKLSHGKVLMGFRGGRDPHSRAVA